VLVSIAQAGYPLFYAYLLYDSISVVAEQMWTGSGCCWAEHTVTDWCLPYHNKCSNVGWSGTVLLNFINHGWLHREERMYKETMHY